MPLMLDTSTEQCGQLQLSRQLCSRAVGLYREGESCVKDAESLPWFSGQSLRFCCNCNCCRAVLAVFWLSGIIVFRCARGGIVGFLVTWL